MKFLNRVKRYIIHACKIVSLLNKVIPKRRYAIVLYSNLGFRDNIRAFFEFLIENGFDKKYRIICSTNDYKYYQKHNMTGARFVNNYWGLIYFLRSKYFLYSFGKYPVKPSSQQVVLNLWHGMPLKKIGNLLAGGKNSDYDYFTHVLSTSPFFKDIMKQAFACDDSKIIICGQPRNDDLAKGQKPDFVQKNEKFIMWLPTFRKGISREYNDSDTSDPLPIFHTSSEFCELNNTLITYKAKLLIKLHPLQDTSNLPSASYSNIYLYTHSAFEKSNLNLYKTLGAADCLITDYSSVYFDFLLLDRPIAFTLDDMEEYAQNRGLVFAKPEQYMPGAKLHNKDEFLDFIKSFSGGQDDFSRERAVVNELVNTSKGFSSCKEIADIIGIKK